MTDRELVITRVFDAPRHLIFKAWIDPKQVAQWWGPHDFTITTHEMDVRPGGVWRYIMHGPNGVDYDNKIVYTEETPMATKSKNDPAAVDAYLATLPKDEQEALESLRQLIKKTIPTVEERISYGTTVMFSLGHDLVGFVSQKKHLSFFTASPKLVATMKEEITKTHKVSGATIHFTPGNSLPPTLVKKIIKARIAENEALSKKSEHQKENKS